MRVLDNRRGFTVELRTDRHVFDLHCQGQSCKIDRLYGTSNRRNLEALYYAYVCTLARNVISFISEIFNPLSLILNTQVKE